MHLLSRTSGFSASLSLGLLFLSSPIAAQKKCTLENPEIRFLPDKITVTGNNPDLDCRSIAANLRAQTSSIRTSSSMLKRLYVDKISDLDVTKYILENGEVKSMAGTTCTFKIPILVPTKCSLAIYKVGASVFGFVRRWDSQRSRITLAPFDEVNSPKAISRDSKQLNGGFSTAFQFSTNFTKKSKAERITIGCNRDGPRFDLGVSIRLRLVKVAGAPGESNLASFSAVDSFFVALKEQSIKRPNGWHVSECP